MRAESDRLSPRSDAKPLVDVVHFANFKAWRKALLSGESWREMRDLRNEIRERKYDLALDLQGSIRSALAAQASGAAMRVGPSEPREKPASMFYTRPIDAAGKHVVEHALSMLSEIAVLAAELLCRPYFLSIALRKPGPLKPWRRSAANASPS